jgi:glycosyltransferase involved in cell wall biosynthesis
MNVTRNKICILPRLNGLGGPVSFYNRLTSSLIERDIELTNDPLAPDCRAILVIGAIRRLDLLLLARTRGIRIVQRLNGMNWLHRRIKTSWKYYLKAEINNFRLALIRRHVAHKVVYQSNFARTWWHTVYKPTPTDGPVIYNGVDLHSYSPIGPETPPNDHLRLLLVEAHVSGGYEQGLENAIRLAEAVEAKNGQKVELMVVGDIPSPVRALWSNHPNAWINWKGVVPHDQIPSIDRSAHLLFSSDLNAACPNSAIEALACGLPVIGFATGSLPELIAEDAGKVVPYGSNYWKLEIPDIPMLASSAREILGNLEHFRQAARIRAENNFSLEVMTEKYLKVLA